MIRPVDLPLIPNNLSGKTSLCNDKFRNKRKTKTKINEGKVSFRSLRTRKPLWIKTPKETAAAVASTNCFGEDTGSYVQLGRIITVTKIALNEIIRSSRGNFEPTGKHYQF